MSYEGIVEHITKDGQYLVTDAWEEEPEGVEWENRVDLTNGSSDEDYGEKEEIGFADQWKEDHYGNKYALRVPLYKPIGEKWRKVCGKPE